MNHDDVLYSLKKHLESPDRIIFTEVGLGSKFMEQSIPIPDVFVMSPSYTKPKITIYEVKAHQSDFLSDVKSEKWERYLPFCDRFFFALDHKIDYEKHIGHQPAGIIIHKEGKWKVVRQSPLNKSREQMDEWVWMSLVFNQHKKARGRVERLEAIKASLLKKEVQSLRFSVMKDLRDISAEIYKKDDSLKNREKNLREKELDTKTHAIDALLRKLGLWSYRMDQKDVLGELLKKEADNILTDLKSRVKNRLEMIQIEIKKQQEDEKCQE